MVTMALKITMHRVNGSNAIISCVRPHDTRASIHEEEEMRQ